MLTAVFCALAGALQGVLLNELLKSALSGAFNKMLIQLSLKLLLYGAAFGVVYFFLKEYIYYAAVGFPIGFFIALAVLLIKSKKQGDDTNEHIGTD